MIVPITRCVAYRCFMKSREVFTYSDGSSEKPVMNNIIVELASGDVSGFGEFLPTSLLYPPGAPGRSALDEWNEILATCESWLGQDAALLRRLIPEKYNDVEDASGIVDCLDFALHDLVGKTRGLPVWALLGGRRHRTVPAVPVLFIDEIDAMVRRAVDLQRAWGFRLFKIKPHARYDTDVKLMTALHQRLRPGTKFLLDAGFAYPSLEEAVKTHADTARFGVFVAEDPFKATFDVYRDQVRPALNRAGVKLMLDEQARDARSFLDIVTNKAADVVNFHANWHSGFSGALERAGVVRLGQMESFMGSSVYTGIADAANILLASLFPNLVACEQVRGSDFYLQDGSLVDNFYPLVNGEYEIPDSPGLGVEVNRLLPHKEMTPSGARCHRVVASNQMTP